MRRRDFLAGGVMAAGSGAHAAAQDSSKLERVGVMSGDFDNLMTEVRDWSHPAAPKQLDIMDFPEMLADRYHIHNVEVQQIHFLSLEPSYYRKFLERVKKAKSRMIDMPLELDERGYSGT